MVVQERDLRLLRELAVMRVADREQAKVAAGFGSTTRTNVRLLKLVRAGLLQRFYVGTGGTKLKAVYAHSRKGAALAGVPYRGPRRKPEEALIADLFVEHQLAVNEVYCAVNHGSVPIADGAFRRWMTFHEPVSSTVRLQPDGYFEIVTPGEVLAAFLEVDLGQERGPVWKKKVTQYLQLAVSGDFKRLFGEDRFRVLVLAPSERRLHQIRKVVAATTPKVFWFATQNAIRADGLFGPVWFRPLGERPQTLIAQLP
jgi:hypothetical protein